MKRYYILILLLLQCGFIMAQTQGEGENIEINYSTSGPFEASDKVVMKPGFVGLPGFSAKINPTLVFAPDDFTYIDGGGNPTTDPSSGSVVGTIKAQFNVTPTGAATYTIPIDCPAGINGMQPNISLSYNSQSGNGLAGWGWNIAGLSMISRVPKDYYHNGETSSIRWDKYSAFALDGQRLFVEASYGPNGTDSVEYFTEQEMAARVVGYDLDGNGPSYFKVYYKNGRVAEYGANKASKYPISYSHRDDEFTGENLYQDHFYGWAITKIKDPNSNYMEIFYELDSVTSTNTQTVSIPEEGTYTITTTNTTYSNTRPSKIKYGANSSKPSDHFAELNFVYESRDDTDEKYISEYLFKQENRLKEIIAKSNDTEVNKYVLAYNWNYANYSMLYYIQQFSNGISKRKTKFTWASEDYAVSTQNAEFVLPESSLHQVKNILHDNHTLAPSVHTGDFDGDGVMDFVVEHNFYGGDITDPEYVKFSVYMNNGTNTMEMKLEEEREEELFKKGIFVLDQDKDGKDELYVQKKHASFYKYVVLDCYEYNGTSFVGNTSKDYKIYLDHVDHYKDIILIPGDFDGDGETDFLSFRDNKFHRSLGITVDENNYGIEDNYRGFELLDMDGDRRTDLLVKYDTKTIVYEYVEGNQNFAPISTRNVAQDKEENYKIGDFNGDGYSDRLTKKGDDGQWTIDLSNGEMFIGEGGMDTPYFPNVENAELFVTDINLDGKSDIIYRQVEYYDDDDADGQATSTVMKVHISDGLRFRNKEISSTDFTDYMILGVTNIQGDFTSDILIGKRTEHGMDISTIKPLTFTHDNHFNRIVAIENGLGDVLNIDYDFATVRNLNVYHQITADLYNNNLYSITNANMKVVSNITATNKDVNYFYGKGIYNNPGKGFIGYDLFGSYDNIMELGALSTFDVQDTLKVLFKRRDISFKDQSLISTNVHIDDLDPSNFISESIYHTIFDINPTEEFVYHQYHDYVINHDYLKGVSTTVENTIDQYLNPLTETQTIYTDNTLANILLTKQTILSGYQANGSWCLNKPTKKQISVTREGETEPYVRETDYSFDTKGNLLTQISDPSDVNKITTTYSEYDSFGQPGRKDINANNITRSETYTYSADGRYLLSNNNLAFGETTTYTYEVDYGYLLSETDHYNRTTSYEYGGFGKLIKTNYADGTRKVNAVQWDDGNGIAGALYYTYSQASGESPIWTYYDILGRELRTESYGLDTQKKILLDTEYNSKGQVYRKVEPYFEGESANYTTTFEYDRYGRDVKKTTPLGIITTGYNGLNTTVTSPNGITSVAKNAAGETISSTVNGKTVSFTYHPSGKTKTALPNGGVALEMNYDLQGNRTELKDPDAGTIWTKYNGFGELQWEKQLIHSSDTTITKYEYHANGLIKKIDRPTEDVDHVYDTRHRLQQVAISGKHSLLYFYDDLDRVTNMTETVDGVNYLTEKEYDELGSLVKETFPSGFYIQNVYNKYGYLTKVKDNSDKVIWEAKEANERGQLTKTNYGNANEKKYIYNYKGQLTSIKSANVISQQYEYLSDGNLLSRLDSLSIQKEQFRYDDENRLKSWSIYKNGFYQDSIMMTYDHTTGNITEKSDLGYSMQYDHTSKPHAVTSINGVPNGVSSFDLEIDYTDFKKIKSIKENNRMLEIFYGMDNLRRKSVYSVDSVEVESQVFLGNYEVEKDSTGYTRKIHYISGGDGVVAIHIIASDSTSTLYPHSDYLGSLISYSDADANLLEQHSYGPWGKRRDPADWQNADIRTSWLLNRGFTGHEHLDQFGLINMNGRVYDPLTASFLSPDPQLQAPENWLNYNRYTYCVNNPMMYNDPNGEIFGSLLIGAIIGGVLNWGFNGAEFSFKGLGYFGVGALSGALTAGVSAGISSSLGGGTFGAGFWGTSTKEIAKSSFGNGLLIGAGAGATSGFTVGMGNALVNGYSFKDSFNKGLAGAGIGAVFGGLFEGVSQGWRATRNGRSFWNGDISIEEKLDNIVCEWSPELDAASVESVEMKRVIRSDEGIANGQTFKGTGYTYANGDLKFYNNKVVLSRKTVRRIWRENVKGLETLKHEIMHSDDYANGIFTELYKIHKSVSLSEKFMEYRAYFASYQSTGFASYAEQAAERLRMYLKALKEFK